VKLPHEDYRVPERECPCCGERLDGAYDVTGGGHAPNPGDWTLCAYCGATLRFPAADDAPLEVIPDAVVASYEHQDEEFAAARRAVLATRRHR
jgi:hypothetical protein